MLFLLKFHFFSNFVVNVWGGGGGGFFLFELFLLRISSQR